MDMNAARLAFEALERSLPPDPLRVWDRRSAFYPINRAASIEIIALLLMICDLALEMQIKIAPLVDAIFAERAITA